MCLLSTVIDVGSSSRRVRRVHRVRPVQVSSGRETRALPGADLQDRGMTARGPVDLFHAIVRTRAGPLDAGALRWIAEVDSVAHARWLS